MRLPTSVACALPLLLLLGAADARRPYQGLIPNGVNVTNPCAPATIWQGVGHWLPGGTGDRNPFGVAFFLNGMGWNQTLCQLDSDGDGKSNGEELGDPSCVWTQGATPSRTTGITHPGICEPVTDAKCKERNGDKITCGATALGSTLGAVCSLLLMTLMLR